MNMISVVAKSINSKYFKKITGGSKGVNPKIQVIKPDQSTIEFTKHNPGIFALENSLKRIKSQQQLNVCTHVLEDLIFEYNFNPYQHIKPQEEESLESFTNKSCFSDTSISVCSIQTIQSEANSPIQDKMVHKTLQSINAECMSIFDGHGGNALSQYASKKITDLIDSYLLANMPKNFLFEQSKQKSISIIKDSIQWAYKQIEQTFLQLLDQQIKTGNKQIIKIGTCAITCIIWEDQIIIGNCGDSQCIIVTEDQHGLCYFKANEQLNTSNLDEINRIQSQFQGIDEQVLVKSKLNNKVYIKGILQPTRTLGDYYLKKQKYFNRVSKASKTPFKGPYIKHTPQFKVIPIKQNFRHLILASDGLWDFATKKEVLKVIEQHNAQLNRYSHGFTEFQLSRAYIEKPFAQETKKLTESLRDYVLQKCAKKKNKTSHQLLQIPPGDRRNYLDDISIITVTFQENSSFSVQQ